MSRDHLTKHSRSRCYDAAVFHLAAMTKQENDFENCSNNGACSNLRGTAVLSLNRHASAIKPPSPPSPTTALAPRFARAYGAECRRPSIEGELLLRETTTALVQRLKADGLPPERVLVALKAAIARHSDAMELTSLSDDDTGPSSRSVHRRVLQWMLESYFDEPV